MPWHPPYRRVAYALVSLLVAITGGLGNALVTANLPFLQGQLALTPTQGSWLVAAYAMVNVTANLLAFKFRQQYGIRLFAEIGLGLYAALAVLHLFVGSFETTMLTRAASGFAGAACSTLGTLYMLQALPAALPATCWWSASAFRSWRCRSPGSFHQAWWIPASGTSCIRSRPALRCAHSPP